MPVTQQNNPREVASKQVPQKSLRIAKEIRHIQHRAAEHDGRIVNIGPLVLFSTQTGDAWILDPTDQLAARLAYDGDPLELYVEETGTNYAIGWQGSYRIDNDTFVYEDNKTGRLIAIRGYPTKLLLRAIAKADRQ